MDTYTTELIFYCSDAPRMFNNVKLIVDIGLTRIHLHIRVPEKKCYKETWTYPSQRDSFVVGLRVEWQGSIRWQQQNCFFRSIITVKEKRESFENEAELQDKKQTSVPGVYQVYRGYLDCHAT